MIRNLFSFVFLLCLFFPAFSQESQSPSSLKISCADDFSFLVYVNGKKQYPEPVKSLTLKDLTAQHYQLKIEMANDLGVIEQDVVVDPMTDYEYGIRATENSDVDKSIQGFKNNLNALTGNKVSQEDEAKSFRNYNFEFIQIQKTQRGDSSLYAQGKNLNEEAANAERDEEGGVVMSVSEGAEPTAEGSGVKANHDCITPTPQEFEEAKEEIRLLALSEKRLDQAREVTRANCLNAAQILEITNCFEFEDAKLKYAKFAFPYCSDQENYDVVKKAFKYESTGKELDQHLESLR